MPGDLEYAHEKFSRTVGAMAVTQGTLRERLVPAYMDHAFHFDPDAGGAGPSMSDELAARVRVLRDVMTADGASSPTQTSLTDAEVEWAADQMVEIADAIVFELLAAEDG